MTKDGAKKAAQWFFDHYPKQWPADMGVTRAGLKAAEIYRVFKAYSDDEILEALERWLISSKARFAPFYDEIIVCVKPKQTVTSTVAVDADGWQYEIKGGECVVVKKGEGYEQ